MSPMAERIGRGLQPLMPRGAKIAAQQIVIVSDRRDRAPGKCAFHLLGEIVGSRTIFGRAYREG